MSKSVVNCYRTSEEERAVIERAAKASGKTLSEYSRAVLLAASDYVVTDIMSPSEELIEHGNGKEKDLHIRFSEAELIFYAEQAKIAGCTMSEYIRRSANRNDIYIIDGLPEITKQIAKLGVNINQLTMLAHQGKIKEVDLFACNDTLKQILKQLLKLTKKKR